MEIKSRIIDGVSKKSGKPYHAIELFVDNGTQKFVSDYIFPTWHLCDDNGNRISTNPLG